MIVRITRHCNTRLSSASRFQARPAVALSAEEVELEARRVSDGDVRRVLSMVKIEIVCKGPREAAAFCRKLKQHPQARYFWSVVVFYCALS